MGLVSRVEKRGRNYDTRKQVRRWDGRRTPPDDFEHRLQSNREPNVRSSGNVLLQAVGLHDSPPVERLGKRCRKVAGLLHPARGSSAHGTTDALHDPRHRWKNNERYERELPVLIEHHRRIGDELGRLQTACCNAARDRIAQERSVVEHG